jgi:hypothetical protein
MSRRLSSLPTSLRVGMTGDSEGREGGGQGACWTLASTV